MDDGENLSDNDFTAGNFVDNCYQTKAEMDDNDILDNDSSVSDAVDTNIADHFTEGNVVDESADLVEADYFTVGNFLGETSDAEEIASLADFDDDYVTVAT